MNTFRVTTNGTIRGYRTSLYKTQSNLNDSMKRVITKRQFSTYAEDPSAASRAFQLRRAMWRTEDQIRNNNTLISRNDIAFAVVDNIVDGTAEEPGLDGIAATIEAITGTAGSSRKSLGQTLLSKATAIVTGMNSAQFGDDFLFAGTDGLNVPLTWGKNSKLEDVLLYRGIDVNTPKPKTKDDFETDQEFYDYRDSFPDKYGMTYADAVVNHAKLEEMKGESAYVDIGLGFREGDDGEVVSSSAYNSALCALTFLGTGADEDGDPDNLVSILHRLGTIYRNCDSETGAYNSIDGAEDKKLAAEADRLLNKLQKAIKLCSEQHVKLSADTDYLQKNGLALDTRSDTLNTQIVELEDINQALAITEMNAANTCYQAALKIGNDILSQSLLDYLR